MATTFQKRQKEMKRLEKQRMKAERRAQKKIINRAERESQFEPQENVSPEDAPPAPAGPEPQN
ncbi:MAG TPA: hypothetical protein VK156_00025 [Candidatus Limnocylindria bacterium]|nr:hypothetical protein [Candidatus Limnocylindria bacterium]